MKSKFLKIEQPCDEQWEKMEPNASGSYCHLCAKNVLDFTQKTPLEIAKILQESKGRLCARITQKQMQLPIPVLEPTVTREFQLPFAKVAAGIVMAAATLASCGTDTATNNKAEYVQTDATGFTRIWKSSEAKPNDTTSKKFTVFRGKVVSQQTDKPVENAKITFFTLTKSVATATLADGSFVLEIPEELVSEKNVVRVSYFDVTEEHNGKKVTDPYQQRDYVLMQSELDTEWNVKAEPYPFLLGALTSYYDLDEEVPFVVVENGAKVNANDFLKALMDKKPTKCTMEHKDYYYFEPEAAIALYGEEAKDGLYIITGETEDGAMKQNHEVW